MAHARVCKHKVETGRARLVEHSYCRLDVVSCRHVHNPPVVSVPDIRGIISIDCLQRQVAHQALQLFVVAGVRGGGDSHSAYGRIRLLSSSQVSS